MPATNRAAALLRMAVACATVCATSADLVLAAPKGADPSARRVANEILAATGVRGGLIVHLGCGDGKLSVALRANGSYVVHGLDADAAKVAKARQYVRELGLYGKVSVDRLAGGRLPYAENLVNLLVADGLGAIPRDEVLRVLCPRGVAYVKTGGRWERTVKPWPARIDEWTHHLHGADGNPVANDSVVAPPAHFQWLAGPIWLRAHDTDSSVNAAVTAAGRVLYMVDEAPIGLPGQHGLPDKWFLVARDAFNGVLLWKRPVEDWGWRAWKDTWFKRRPGNMPLNLPRRLVAVGDHVYVTMGYRAPVSRLDAATGRTLRVYDGTERTNEILVRDNTLLLSMNSDEGVRIAAIAAETGKLLWRANKVYRGTKQEVVMWPSNWAKDRLPKLDPAPNLTTDGRFVCLLDGTDVVCLDAATGQERWRTTVPDKRGDLWVGTLILRDGVVLHATPSQLVALSAETGKRMWSRPKSELGWLWFEWKDVFVVGDLVWTWSAELERKSYRQGKRKGRSAWPGHVNGYDLRTGELTKHVPLGKIFTAHHHHRCYRNKATLRYILASRRGTEFVDLAEGKHTVHNWVRGACHLGMMPANGLQYAPPHPCRCYINEKLNGFLALAPASAEASESRPASQTERLERGPAYAQIRTGPPDKLGKGDPGDWPTFRHDAIRSSFTSADVPADLETAWRSEVGGRLSSPIVAAGMVFLASVDAHTVAALDARTGRKRWEFTAGGRVDSPPTFHRGTVLFGSADGWAYCLRASDGKLAWRFRAAPEDRRMGAFGQIESVWPVHGSVLIRDRSAGSGPAVVYFAAGRSSYLDGGIRLYALDAATGEQNSTAVLLGPRTDFSDGEAHFRYGSGPGALTDILQSDGRRVYMRSVAFDESLSRQAGEGTPRVRPMGGFLDDTYMRRAFWWFAAQANRGRLIAHGGGSVYILRMFRSMKMLTPDNFFTPGKEGYQLIAERGSRLSQIRVDNSASLNPAGRPLTVEAWIKADAGDGAILARGGSASGYALVLTGGRPRFVIRVKDKTHAVTARETVGGEWTHLAGVLTERKKLLIYVNGRQAASADAPSLIAAPPGQSTEIGADVGTGVGDYDSPFAFRGLIDEVRIHHRALAADEIGAHCAEPDSTPRKADKLVLCFSFDKAGAADESGNGNNGQLDGAEPVEGKVGKAMRFTGPGKPGWSIDIPLRGTAMVATPRLLFLAGPPDVMDPADPLGAFEGRMGGLLWIFDADTGRKRAEHRLDSPPVFNGMAAANGRLYITTADGRVQCMMKAK